MLYQNLAILFLFGLFYSILAGRLERTPVNGAVVYVLFGAIFGPIGLGLLDLSIEREGIRLLAELTLALVLFADASSANLDVVRRAIRLPGRMLLVGLPFVILLGFGFGVLLFPGLGILEVAILATMLAPTDAALGKAVVSNPVVPAPVREGLNVESGLNDGICVPILLTFLALATVGAGEGGSTALALTLVAEEIGIGLVIGVGLTAAASWGLKMALQRGWLHGPVARDLGWRARLLVLRPGPVRRRQRLHRLFHGRPGFLGAGSSAEARAARARRGHRRGPRPHHLGGLRGRIRAAAPR